MDNSLNLSEDFWTFLNTRIEYDTNLETVLEEIDDEGYAPDSAFPLCHNDYVDDPCDQYGRTWREGEEHILINIYNKPRLAKSGFQSTNDKRNEERFINALTAIRRLYAYRHKRNRNTPLLENNHAALVRVAIELALESFTVGRGMLGTILWCAEQSLSRTEIDARFMDGRPNVPKTKGLPAEDAERVRAVRRERNHREKVLRGVLSIITAGKEDATQKEQAELVGVQPNTLRSHIELAWKTLSDKRYMKEHPELKCKFTTEQLDSIRLFLSQHVRHDNGVGARAKRKDAEDNAILALLDFRESVSQNRERIGAELRRAIPRQTFYDILKRRGIPTTKFKNTKHIKNENTRNFQCGGVCQAAETVPERGSALYGEGL